MNCKKMAKGGKVKAPKSSGLNPPKTIPVSKEHVRPAKEYTKGGMVRGGGCATKGLKYKGEC